MKRFTPLLSIFGALLLPSCSMADIPEADNSYLPLSIDQVETYRVGEHLLRLIKHNMEMEPVFELELIDPIGPRGLDRQEMTSILLGGETLNFSESAGVFIESMGVNKEGATLVLEYFHQQGGVDRIECVVPVINRKITAPKCHSNK